MEEYDPYAQHNPVPEVGYIDPPVEPYRYISPVKREIKTMGAPTTEPNAKNARKPSPEKEMRCASCRSSITGAVKSAAVSVGVQTTLTMAQIERLEMIEGVPPTSEAPRAVSAGGSTRRIAPALATRRPAEPLRSSSAKKTPAVTTVPTVPVATTRSKSSAKTEVVVAAPRSSRVTATSAATKGVVAEGGPSLAARNTTTTVQQEQRLLDVTPTAARRMFSGSGNNGVRSHSSNKTSSLSTPPPASTPATSLKRGKSSERPSTISIGGGSAGAALQAALARNLLRKQATSSAAKADQFATQSSGTGSARRPAGEFTTGDASPTRPKSATGGLSTLSTPASMARGGPANRALSASPGTALSALNPPPPPARYSRVPSSGSQGPAVATTPSQRRVAGSTAVGQSSSSVTASKRVSTVAGVAPPPTRTPSSKVVSRKVVPDSVVRQPSYSDPASDSLSAEVRKAQGINQQIVHSQASLDGRDQARLWQQKADERPPASE